MGVSESKALLSDPSLYATHVEKGVDESSYRQYDYVIIGGGSAGCVLASRLSEDAGVTVLLLEAGKSHESELFTRIPLAFAKNFKTSTDWDFHTVPQSAMGGREVYWPRGKILGGTSAINALIFHHCAPEDFEEWVKLGAEDWSYEALLPYFRKSEHYNPSPLFPEVNVVDRGRDGPWQLGHGSEYAPINKGIRDACENLGIPYNPDLNTARGTMGVTDFIGMLDARGRRSSTATAYLTKDVLARPNLTVAINAMVEKILFDMTGEEPRAMGVELSTAPTSPRYRIRAAREVILSAGTVGSPQILLLSGVGPAKELKELGIPVVKDLQAVGKNLSDHISCGPLNFRGKPGFTWDHLMKPLPGAFALFKWLMFGSGPMASLGTSAGAFVRSDDSSLPLRAENVEARDDEVKDLTSGPNAPDIELAWAPIVVMDHGFKNPPAGTYGITMGAFALKPESTGSVTLKSGSVWDKPLIDANYFVSESDLNVVLRGTRLCLHIARTEPLSAMLDLKPHSTDKTSFFWPGDADPDQVTDEELKAWIRRNAAPPFHPISTNRIGLDPATSVVTNNLRVHGVSGLRVVDASVFPAQISGHPCAIVVGIAERISDNIKRSK